MQLENERRLAEENQLLQQVEINRLKEELSLLKPLVPSRRNFNTSSSHGLANGSQGLDSSSHGGALIMTSSHSKPAVSWFSLDYWFSGGSSTTVIESTPIMKV